MKQKRIELMKMFKLITIAAVVLLSIIIVIVLILSNVSEFEKRAETMRVDYVAQQEAMIKREVQRAVAMINEARLSVESETRKLVKQRVYEALAVVENIYQESKNSKSKDEIESLIVNALRGIRFADGSGYYFITGLDGVEILFADKPELEGVNLLNIQDPNGKYVVRDMVEIANSSGEGFYEYHWSKPDTAGKNHRKVSYVRLFEPLGFFIGTGLYVADIESQIKAKLLILLSKVSFGENGYLFVDGLDGSAFVSSGKVYSGSQKVWELYAKHADQVKIAYEKALVAALTPDGDFVYYSIGKSVSAAQAYSKASFVYGIPEWQWFIGAGVYLDGIEASIAVLQERLQQQERIIIAKTIVATLLIIAFILFLFHLVSVRLQKDFALFVSFFEQAAYADKEIDCQQIYFDGLADIAVSANAMLVDKKKALAKIKVSEEKYRNLFDNAMVGLFRSRLSDGLYLEANDKAAAMLGCKIEDIVGKIKTTDLYKDNSQREKLLAELEQNGYADDFEVDLINPDGREVFYSISVKIYPDDGYMEGIAVDITDRRRAEKLLQESEERFREMANLLPQPIFESNLEMRVTYANVQAFKLFGYTDDALDKGLFATDLFVPEDMQRVVENTAAQFRGEKNIHTEYGCMKNDGSTFPVLFHISPIIKGGKPCGLRGIIIDLTEQKKIESLLQEGLDRFQEMADLLPGAVYETNLDRIFTYVNHSAYELFGYTEEDVARGLDGIEMFAPEERPRVLKNVEAQYAGEVIGGVEYLAMKKDGTTFPAFFKATPIAKNGKICGRRGIVIDLTGQKQAEEEVLKLRKLESVGVLAGGIAHDFNNLLAGIFGNLEMAKRFLPVDHKSFKYIESAGMSMERATGLTRQLLTFAKGGDPIKETLSLEGVIVETAQFSLRGSNVKLQLNIDPKLWLVAADKGQLSQVVSNLVINAKQAMPDGGAILIDAVNSESPTGKQIKITVKDQGVGIAPQYLDKIFDPYFSTKQQGSGLGLASCYSIIAKHGGTIGVESELNHGTMFTIMLPVTKGQIDQQSVAAGKDSPAAVHLVARILILDDEELVQQMSTGMLAEMGHRVDCANDGAQAIEKYRLALAESDGYDIVICDLTIPGGMGGQEAAQKIMQINPQANLIVSSGYATDPIMANYSEYGFRGQVAKPYSFAALQQAVQGVLEA